MKSYFTLILKTIIIICMIGLPLAAGFGIIWASVYSMWFLLLFIPVLPLVALAEKGLWHSLQK